MALREKKKVMKESTNDSSLTDEVKALLMQLNLPGLTGTSEIPSTTKNEVKKIEKKAKYDKKKETKKRKKKKSAAKVESESEEEDAYDQVQEVATKNKHTTFEDAESDDDVAYIPDASEQQEEQVFYWFFDEPSVIEPAKEGESTLFKNYDKIAEFRTKAESAMKNRQAVKESDNDEESRWMSDMMRSGTLSDKVAAMALLVSKSPIMHLETLESLVQMAGKKGRREAKLAIDALADLFRNNLLPEERCLMTFNVRFETISVKSAKHITSDHLVYWLMESEIKAKYLQFLRFLETWSFDTMEFAKRMAISTAFQLIRDRPEQEQFLLMLIVNKLGDPEKKLASHAVYLLSELIKAHPNMRIVVATEVEQFMFRPKSPARGIYYSTIFLNQIVLQRAGDEALAQKLIAVYVRLFERAMARDDFTSTTIKVVPTNKKKKGKRAGKTQSETVNISETFKSKLMSAILTGVNRAFPYANTVGAEMDEQVNLLFKMVHVGTFVTTTQALMLLLQIMGARNASSDRLYRTLYGVLLSADFRSSTKSSMFLNVVYKSLRRDDKLPRLRAFIKRLLQVSANAPAPVAAGVLFLISTIISEKPGLKRMITGSDEPVQTMAAPKPAREDSLKLLISDSLDPDVRADQLAREEQLHSELEAERLAEGDGLEYDTSKRDPMFAGCGTTTKLWELQVFTKHFHPAVRAFASSLLVDPKGIEYSGDPLKDLSTSAFLERFVYRNPRKRDLEVLKDSSASTFGLRGRLSRMGRGITKIAANSPAFLLQDGSKVNPDEKFLFDYFHKRAENHSEDLREQMAIKSLKISNSANRDEFLDDDDEEEMDAFADKLAEDMMKEEFGNPDMDGDDLDVDYDDPDFDRKLSQDKERAMLEYSESEDEELDEELDGDSDSDEELDEDSEDMEDVLSGSSGDEEGSNNMMDADQFAEILENAGKSNQNKKEAKWESRIETKAFSQNRKKRKTRR